jgi:hypothetical protein
MTVRKNVKSQTGTTGTNILEVLSGSDLSSRIEKLSEQTGLDVQSLLQKWVLQEESLIALMLRGKNHGTEQVETPAYVSQQLGSDALKQGKTVEVNPDRSDYRKVLIKRINKLKKEGIPLFKIAKIFNEENLQTLSGKGKWHSSSIIWLLNSKV